MVKVVIGLGDLEGIFQPKKFYDSKSISYNFGRVR